MRWAWLGPVAGGAAAWLAVNYLFPGRLSADANLYLAQPVIWGLLALLSLLLLWRLPDATLIAPRVVLFGVWAAVFQVAATAGTGLLYGYGYSPYAREPVHMLQNGLYLAALLAGVECSRAYLIARFYPRSPLLTICAVTLFCAVLVVPATAFSSLDSGESSFEAIGRVLLPGLALSLLASYLAARGGPAPALLCHAIIVSFEWFSPVLPHLDWAVTGFIGTVAPIVSLLSFRGLLTEGHAERTQARYDVSAGWVVASMAVVALLWFNTGVFGVEPAIVSGVSMEPTLHANDLVIVRDVDPDDLSLGDVVRLDKHGVTVIHRVVEIEDTASGRVFVTQGDNNNTPDEPILAGEIRGKVILTVPKLGWIPTTVKRVLARGDGAIH